MAGGTVCSSLLFPAHKAYVLLSGFCEKKAMQARVRPHFDISLTVRHLILAKCMHRYNGFLSFYCPLDQQDSKQSWNVTQVMTFGARKQSAMPLIVKAAFPCNLPDTSYSYSTGLFPLLWWSFLGYVARLAFTYYALKRSFSDCLQKCAGNCGVSGGKCIRTLCTPVHVRIYSTVTSTAWLTWAQWTIDVYFGKRTHGRAQYAWVTTNLNL